MASNFWIGTSVEVTSGSKIVTVLASDDDISLVLEGSSFVASNYSIPFEVNRTYNDGANDIIELKEEWSGATSSSVVATVVVGPGAIAATRESVVNLISAYEEFEALVSPVVSANAIPQRTSTGQLKTADAVNDDEAVAKGQLGTAAYKDVGTSDNDVMEVGAFGVGTTESVNYPTDDFDSTGIAAGKYRIDSDTLGTRPDGFNSFGTVEVSRLNANQHTQLFIDSAGNVATQFVGSSGPEGWVIVNPQLFGIGTTNLENLASVDLDTIITTGNYVVNSNCTNTPDGSSAFYLTVQGADDTGNVSQIAAKKTSGSPQFWVRTFSAGSTSGWKQLYHSDNTGTAITYNAVTSATDDTADRLLKVGSATILSGLLAPTAPNSNLNEVVGTQVVRADNANDGPPDTIDGISAGMVFHVNRFDSASAHKASQLAFGLANSGEYPSALWHRALSGTGNESDWALVYDSGNTNFNEFGGNGTNDRIARATGRGNTTAFVELPLNSPTPPTGITVTGTFILTDATGNNTLVSGIDSTFFSIINTRPSNKFFTVWLTFSSASVTSGLPMYLQTASADAKIEVTF